MILRDFILFFRTNRRRVLWVFCIALLMHILFFLLFAYFRGIQFFWTGPDDVQAYTKLGLHILQNHSFLSYSGQMPESWYTPGYPFFLSMLYLLFHNWIFAVLIQNVIASFSAVLIFYMGSKYFSAKTGFWAALLFAAEPTNAYISNFLWSETLFLFLFLLFLLCFLGLILSKGHISHWRITFFASLFLAAATYVRQITIFLPFFLIPLIIFIHFFISKISRQKVLAFIGLLIIFFTLIAPWSIRNKLLFNSWSMGAAGIGTLYFYDAVPFAYFKNANSTIGYMLGTEIVLEPAGNIKPPKPNDPAYHYTGQGGLSKEKFMFNGAMEIISQHPAQYGLFHITNAVIGLFGIDRWRSILNRLNLAPQEVGFTKLFLSRNLKKIYTQSTKSLLWLFTGMSGLLFSLLITICMCFGIIMGLGKNALSKKIAVLILTVILLYFIATTGPAGYRERYKYPLTPIMFIFAAEGLQLIHLRFKNLKNRSKGMNFT
jgi:4-amino-4-deoxy-L-arabinose transferase-like glycosyltransferase